MKQRELQIYLVGNMVGAGMSTEEEHCPEQPLNNEEGNIREREFWVDLNEIQDNKSELKRTLDELSSELRKVKEDNERILKAQEELNTILLAKIHNEEKDKNNNFEHELPKNASYNKCNGMKLEFSRHNPNTSSEKSVKHHIKSQESSESSDENKKKKKYTPYEEISREFKKF